ncbi:MAG: hypothetical protein O2983_17230 [Planctomycetota bacterium]|nr:hypothetical protein [Planctomycetota bacterium]
MVIPALIFLSVSVWSPLHADESEAERSTDSRSPLQTVHVTTHGVGRYQPGRWGTLSIEAANRGFQAATVEAAAWIGRRANDQVGRSVWLPAEARRTSWMPVVVPSDSSVDEAPMLQWMVVRRSGEGEVFSTGRNQDRIETRQLIEPRENIIFAVITDDDSRNLAKLDLLRRLMEKTQSQVTVLTMSDAHLPVIPEALDAVRVLVVMGDILAQNAAATESVQDWVRLGGTLWLMLDSMNHESAQTICGGELRFTEIDRVSLTSYSLLADTSAVKRVADEAELERPVQLVRVFSESGSVSATADGWPAVVKSEFGQGRIVASMLGLDGFFVPTSNLLPDRLESQNRQIWVTTAGQDLLSEFGRAGSGSPLQTETMKEYVTSRIGYQLPNRSTGAAVLIVFCVSLILVCGIVHRMQKPALLLPGIGLLAVLSILAFLQIAASVQTTDSAATIQIVEATGTQDRLQVTGVTAFHSQGTTRPQIESTNGGMLRFEHAVSSGSPVRSLWSDQNVWKLQNAEFAAGVRMARFRQTVPIQQPVIAKGTFDENGFRGWLTGNLSSNWSDAIVAGQSRVALPVAIDAAGEIAPAHRSLPPGQYLDSALLNAEQSRRQTIYRNMFDASQRSRIYPARPTLFAWSAPLKLQTGRVDSDDHSQAGAMLAAIPVAIERPDAGMRVRIPPTFLPYRSVKNSSMKFGFAPNFSNTRRTWTANTNTTASTALLRFEIPSELLPLSVDGARLTLNISAPLRVVEISAGRLNSLSHVWSRNSPVGTFQIPFPDDASRQHESDGGFHVVLKVGAVQLDELDATEEGTQDRNWQIQWMQLEIEGLIQ